MKTFSPYIIIFLIVFGGGCSRFPIKRVVFWSDPTEIIVSTNGEVAIRFLDYSEPSTAQDAYIHIERGAFIKFLQTHSLSGEDKNYAESGCIRFSSFRNKEKPMINALKYDLNGEEHEIHLSTFYAMSPREFRKR